MREAVDIRILAARKVCGRGGIRIFIIVIHHKQYNVETECFQCSA